MVAKVYCRIILSMSLNLISCDQINIINDLSEHFRNHRTMSSNIKCVRGDNFPGGITNGAKW